MSLRRGDRDRLAVKERKADTAARSFIFLVTAKVALHLQLIYCWSWTPSTMTLPFAGVEMLLTVSPLVTGKVYP
jgi:hypothetical protein